MNSNDFFNLAVITLSELRDSDSLETIRELSKDDATEVILSHTAQAVERCETLNRHLAINAGLRKMFYEMVMKTLKAS